MIKMTMKRPTVPIQWKKQHGSRISTKILFLDGVFLVGLLFVTQITIANRVVVKSEQTEQQPPSLSSSSLIHDNDNDKISKKNENKCDSYSTSLANHTQFLYTRPCQPITIAYAISLVKCGDKLSTPAGMVDAALILRHSIHKLSSRVGVSHYNYKLYVIVHTDAEQCSQGFRDAGLDILVRPPPIQKDEIRGEFLRSKIHREVCCGHDEFIKLYTYALFSEPVVVHVDIDFLFHKPMDDLFDTLLYHKESSIGRNARRGVKREFPDRPFPNQPQAFMTRDWPQVTPGRKAGFQAGFIVTRSNPQVLQDIVEVIKEGNYVDGYSRENGWGGKGYGGFVGAMAMQGLIAYYYDQKAPDTWVELDQCEHNHLGMDVRFNKGGPGFRPRQDLVGKCRNEKTECEDCRKTSLDRIYSIHYSPCRKPWNCIGEGDSIIPPERKPIPKRLAHEKEYIPESYTDMQHCLELIKIWHDVRTDLEHLLSSDSSSSLSPAVADDIARGQTGTYKSDIFQGHCERNGKYLVMAGGNHSSSFLQQILHLYDEPK